MNNSHNLQNYMKDIPKAAHHLGLFTLLLICGVSLPTLSGLLVFPFSLIPTEMTLTYDVGLCIIFLFSTAASYRNKSLKKYWTVWSAFFIASFAILIDISVNIPTTSMDVMANGLREELLYRGLIVFSPNLGPAAVKEIFPTAHSLKTWSEVLEELHKHGRKAEVTVLPCASIQCA